MTWEEKGLAFDKLNCTELQRPNYHCSDRFVREATHNWTGRVDQNGATNFFLLKSMQKLFYNVVIIIAWNCDSYHFPGIAFGNANWLNRS